MRQSRWLAVSLAALGIGAPHALAAVLCRKPSGVLVARDGACKKKESAFDLSQLSGGGGGGGGGGTGLDAEIDQSGSRLRVRYFAGADGSREFIGFFDSQRNENCAFTWGSDRAADATIRCLPNEWISSINDNYFQDSLCTQPLRLAVASEGTNCPPPAYAETRTSNQCPTLIDLYDVGPQFQGSVYYYINGLGCRTQTFPAGYVTYTVGNEVPSSAFVAASILAE